MGIMGPRISRRFFSVGKERCRKDSSFSEEKEAKRLLSVGASCGVIALRIPKEHTFFASFFQKKSAS
jgi:hypothetical protein